jgi:tRNA pseudouridine38-40 synthase
MNLRLDLEYDGTEFFGWQRQPNARTVQGVIAEAIETIFGQKTKIIGAGRTDTGVHALNYVCNFHVETDLSLERIHGALMANTPRDVVIHRVTVVPDEFHARFNAISRRYLYHISMRPTALWRRVFHVTKYDLDVDAMTRAAAHFVGEHDFTSLTPKVDEVPMVCIVSAVDVLQDDRHITISVESNRFLHNMVRIIAGTLMEVGRSRITPEHIPAILRKRDRRAAGPTAPAHGLSLVEIRYPDSD